MNTIEKMAAALKVILNEANKIGHGPLWFGSKEIIEAVSILTAYQAEQGQFVRVRRDRLDEAILILESGCPDQECPNNDDPNDGSIDCKACWKDYLAGTEQ